MVLVSLHFLFFLSAKNERQLQGRKGQMLATGCFFGKMAWKILKMRAYIHEWDLPDRKINTGYYIRLQPLDAS
jgi:hypothetical protein